jgi:hypothetical protein
MGCVLWSVRVSWRGGPSSQKTRVLGGRNAPLYHTGTTQCCSYGLDDRQCHSNGPILQVGQWLWLHAISWRLHTRYQRQGTAGVSKKRRSNRQGLLGACVLNLCQWHGADRAKWPLLRCGTPFRPPHRSARPGPQVQPPPPTHPPTQPSTPARALPGTAPARGPRGEQEVRETQITWRGSQHACPSSACHCPRNPGRCLGYIIPS